MQNTTKNWKTEIADLRARATAVEVTDADLRMTARAAARCLSGVIGHVSRLWSTDLMQHACAEIARHDAAWKTTFRILPAADGELATAIELIAVVARGILPLCGPDAMRAALAFWASEADPSVWQRVTGLAA